MFDPRQHSANAARFAPAEREYSPGAVLLKRRADLRKNICGQRHPGIAEVQPTSHTAKMDQIDKDSLAAAVKRLPEWLRHDLASKDSMIRDRAEDALAAMLAGALDKKPVAEG